MINTDNSGGETTGDESASENNDRYNDCSNDTHSNYKCEPDGDNSNNDNENESSFAIDSDSLRLILCRFRSISNRYNIEGVICLFVPMSKYLHDQLAIVVDTSID